jgi:amino acid transporter
MFARLKEIILGPPLPTHSMGERTLNKVRALAAFSPGALASIAYSNQEIFLGLVVAGSAGLSYAWPIGVAIAGLLAIVTLSYFQTLEGYPSGGGSYVVARTNLGDVAGLLAAAALIVDYILNAAVSLTSGVAAVTSAFPALAPHRVMMALGLLLIITLINLRGIHEAGTVMAVPVYFFLGSFFLMLVYGLIRLLVEGPASLAATAPPAVHGVTLFLLLHTFSTGATALTGIEAVSNGVPAFRPPQRKNAGRTLIVMALLMGALSLGSIGETQILGVVAGPHETILSALARRLFDDTPLYFLMQFATLAILTVATNTSFAGFPRLAAVMARDGFLPRQFGSPGDRLAFSNGILVLSVSAAGLIVLFGGDTHALIPLFAIGAFLAFTLSQTGMVIHWLRERGRGWSWKSAINGVGALATGTTLVIVCLTKFVEGAWITVLIIPVLVLAFRRVFLHYQDVRRALSLRGLPPSLKPAPPSRVVIPVSGVHRGVVGAVAFAQSISQHITGVYVEMEPGAGERIREAWKKWWPEIPLVVVPSPYRSIIEPLMEFLDKTDREHNDGQLATVVLPEFIPNHWWGSLLHNQTAWLLKAALLYGSRRGDLERVVIDVPFHLTK